MPQNAVAAADIAEHAGGHLAGEGAAFLVMGILAAKRHPRRRPPRGEAEGRGHGRRVERRRAENEIDAARLCRPGSDGLGEAAGLGRIEVHLPVAGDDRLPAGGHAGISERKDWLGVEESEPDFCAAGNCESEEPRRGGRERGGAFSRRGRPRHTTREQRPVCSAPRGPGSPGGRGGRRGVPRARRRRCSPVPRPGAGTTRSR